jgi:hypothetical protein
VYEFTGFFARPGISRPMALPPGAVWREITSPFVGVGVRLPDSNDEPELLAPPDVEALARQLGLEAADCWVYLTYVCWGGDIDFVYGLGSHRGRRFGPVKEDEHGAVEAAYTGLMEQFGVPAEVALQFEPFRRGYWGEG